MTILFSDLQQAYETANDKYKQYLADCELIAGLIWEQFSGHHQIPPTQLGLYVMAADGSSEHFNGPLPAAMRLLDDSFFEFGLGITMFSNAQKLPWETTVLPIQVALDGGGMHKARLGMDGKIFLLNKTDIAGIQIFTEHVLSTVIDQYQNGLAEMIRQNTMHRIGFKI